MIGEAFRLRRQRRNLRIVDVANIVKSSPITVRRYENGFLQYTRGNAKAKLDELNRQWIHEDH